MYILWYGNEEVNFLDNSKYIHKSESLESALKIIKDNGIPIIISFGKCSEPFARYFREHLYHLTEELFSFRIHDLSVYNNIMRIMNDE